MEVASAAVLLAGFLSKAIDRVFCTGNAADGPVVVQNAVTSAVRLRHRGTIRTGQLERELVGLHLQGKSSGFQGHRVAGLSQLE